MRLPKNQSIVGQIRALDQTTEVRQVVLKPTRGPVYPDECVAYFENVRELVGRRLRTEKDFL